MFCRRGKTKDFHHKFAMPPSFEKHSTQESHRNFDRFFRSNGNAETCLTILFFKELAFDFESAPDKKLKSKLSKERRTV